MHISIPEDLTFIVPIKVDSKERFENLRMAVSSLCRSFEANISVYESLSAGNSLVREWVDTQGRVSWQGIQETGKVFHRTKILNKAIREASTKFVAIWDADVVVAPLQILAALEALGKGECDFILPYDGRFLNVSGATRDIFLKSGKMQVLFSGMGSMQSMYTHLACGGAFLVRKKDCEEVGLENQNFKGWGNEDGERISRWRKMGKRISRVRGPLFHLDHPRGLNSSYMSAKHKAGHIGEFHRIDSMGKPELELEIQKWKIAGQGMF